MEEIVNRITRKNSKLISELPLTISAQQGLIDQNEFFDKRVASKDVSGYYLIKNGEFAYNKSTSNDAPWGAIKRLDRYENGVLSTLYIVFEIKDETLVNSDFLVAYYSTNLWHKGIHEIAAEGARNHGLLNIAPTDFFKTKLKLPADIEEQKEIGEYFKKIDLLITFHHRKSNLFNKTCRNAWEQRKLNEVAEKICVGFVGTCEKFYTDESGVPMYRTGNLNGLSLNRDDLKYVTNEFHQHNQKSQLKAGDILIARHGDSGKAVNYESSEEANCLNIVIIRPDFKKCNYKFLTNCINSPECQKHIKSLSAGSTQAVINTSEIEKLGVVMPTNIDEQNRIARYFSNLDNLITLHQRKCNQLQIIRKYMLKNIFL